MGDKIEAKGVRLDAEEETSTLPRNGVKGHGVPRERGGQRGRLAGRSEAHGREEGRVQRLFKIS